MGEIQGLIVTREGGRNLSLGLDIWIARRKKTKCDWNEMYIEVHTIVVKPFEPKK